MRLAAGIVGTAIALASQCAAAQNYPEKSIRLIAEGANVETTTPEELMAFVRAEVPKWAKAVKDSGARLD